MLIKARADGFKEAMEIFELAVTSNGIEGEPLKLAAEGAGISVN
jgi:hypothetical protein